MGLQFVDYDENAPFALADDQKEWFEKKAEWLDSEYSMGLEVIWANGSQIIRTDDPMDTGIVKIFDFGTPQADTEYVQKGHMYWEHPEDHSEKFLPFSIRQTIRRNDQTKEKMVMYPSMGSSSADYTAGTFDLLTLWYRMALKNLRQSSPDVLNSTNEIMDAWIGCWIDKAIDANYFTEKEQAEKKKVRDQFLRIAHAAGEQRLNQVKQRLTQTEQQIAQHQQQLVGLSVTHKDLTRELEHAEGVRQDDDTVIERNLEELLENEKFLRVEFDANSAMLRIYTKELYLYSPDHTERTILGSMRIDLSPQSKAVKIYNLTNMKGDRQHPHVPREGDPCWGGLEVPIRNMLRDGELIGFTEATLDYLENYNPQDSWGKWADYWWSTQESEIRQEDGSWIPKSEIPQVVQNDGEEAISEDELLQTVGVEEQEEPTPAETTAVEAT